MSDTPRTDEKAGSFWEMALQNPTPYDTFVDAAFARTLERELSTLQESNRRMREALEFYADKSSWNAAKTSSGYDIAPALKETGNRAREALK